VCVPLFCILCFFVCSCCPRSALRSSKTPIVGISNYQNSEDRRFRLSKCRCSAFWIFDLGNKGIFVLPLYLKASELQSSSVYHWSSLEEDLYYTQPISIRNKAYYRLLYLQHLVLSYKEHVLALVAFKPTNL